MENNAIQSGRMEETKETKEAGRRAVMKLVEKQQRGPWIETKEIKGKRATRKTAAGKMGMKRRSNAEFDSSDDKVTFTGIEQWTGEKNRVKHFPRSIEVVSKRSKKLQSRRAKQENPIGEKSGEIPCFFFARINSTLFLKQCRIQKFIYYHPTCYVKTNK